MKNLLNIVEMEQGQRKNYNFIKGLLRKLLFICYTSKLLKYFTNVIVFVNNVDVFFYKKNFYKKLNLKNPQTLRKCSENIQPQMPAQQFLRTLIYKKYKSKLQN